MLTSTASAAPVAPTTGTLRQKMDRCQSLVAQLQPEQPGITRCHVSPVVTKEEAMVPGSLRRRHSRCMELIAQLKATID